MFIPLTISLFFFFNDTATTEIYTLSLHDALPIYADPRDGDARGFRQPRSLPLLRLLDRKSTRLNSSHVRISYAVFCLKKKKTKETSTNDCDRRQSCPLSLMIVTLHLHSHIPIH